MIQPTEKVLIDFGLRWLPDSPVGIKNWGTSRLSPHSLVEAHRDLLTGSLDIYLSAVANRTNEVMKVLTIYGTLALPLVIITGFFGMNLHLPWGSNPHGIWYVSGLMALSILLVLLYFKWKRWF